MYKFRQSRKNNGGVDFMKRFVGRSDVASEVVSRIDGELSGVVKTEYAKGGVRVTKIKITEYGASEIIGKPQGEYVTVDIGKAYEDDSAFQAAIGVVSSEISGIIKRKTGKRQFTAFVVGLGNSELTSDAIGPETAKGIIVTRHIKEFSERIFEEMNFNSVSVAVPGVLGNTGIESSAAVKALSKEINPDVIIAVDALASDNPERLCRTVQITDTGISPGSGVGNSRKELSEKTLSVPVIAVGVPTVSDSLTVTGSVISGVLSSLKNSVDAFDIAFSDRLSSAWNEDAFETVKNKVSETALSYIVTPKDIDILVKKAARLVSISINKALHNGISEEDINALLGG